MSDQMIDLDTGATTTNVTWSDIKQAVAEYMPSNPFNLPYNASRRKGIAIAPVVAAGAVAHMSGMSLSAQESETENIEKSVRLLMKEAEITPEQQNLIVSVAEVIQKVYDNRQMYPTNASALKSLDIRQKNIIIESEQGETYNENRLKFFGQEYGILIPGKDNEGSLKVTLKESPVEGSPLRMEIGENSTILTNNINALMNWVTISSAIPYYELDTEKSSVGISYVSEPFFDLEIQGNVTVEIEQRYVEGIENIVVSARTLVEDQYGYAYTQTDSILVSYSNGIPSHPIAEQQSGNLRLTEIARSALAQLNILYPEN